MKKAIIGFVAVGAAIGLRPVRLGPSRAARMAI